MMPVLEDAETRAMVFPISRDAYQAFGRMGLLGEDVELIDGVILKKRPESPFHILLVRRLLAWLEAAALQYQSAGGERVFVAKEDPIAGHNSEPEPDLAVIFGTPDDYGDSLPGTALLVIEVSVSTSARDDRKAELYASANVAEYWIVDGDRLRIERFTSPLPESGEYQHHEILTSEGTVTSVALPPFSVRLSDLFLTG